MNGYHGTTQRKFKEITSSLSKMAELPFRDVLAPDEIERILRREYRVSRSGFSPQTLPFSPFYPNLLLRTAPPKLPLIASMLIGFFAASVPRLPIRVISLKPSSG